MTSLSLYYMPESGPCRTVMLVANYLGVKLQLKHIDLFKGEHVSEEFIKLNPQHAVPVLTDGDFVLSESRAMITYLCGKYGKDELLYPKDPKKRAIINQRLYFDLGTLYHYIVGYYRVVFYFGAKKFDEAKFVKIEEAFKILDTFLQDQDYVAGNNLTIADFALISSVETAVAVFDFDLKKYKNVNKWVLKLKGTLPGYEDIIVKNGKKSRILVDSCLVRNNNM